MYRKAAEEEARRNYERRLQLQALQQAKLQQDWEESPEQWFVVVVVVVLI